MVVPIRDQGNITPSATSMSFNSLNLTTKQDINMDTNPIKAMFNLNNNLDEVRGCSLDMSIHRPRSPSLLLSISEEEYHLLLSLQMVDLVFFYFTSQFYFHFILFLYFLFLEQLGLGLIGHAITSVTIGWRRQIMRCGRI